MHHDRGCLDSAIVIEIVLIVFVHADFHLHTLVDSTSMQYKDEGLT